VRLQALWILTQKRKKRVEFVFFSFCARLSLLTFRFFFLRLEREILVPIYFVAEAPSLSPRFSFCFALGLLQVLRCPRLR